MALCILLIIVGLIMRYVKDATTNDYLFRGESFVVLLLGVVGILSIIIDRSLN